MKTEQYEDVIKFWFPNQVSDDTGAMVCQWEWWFRGGGDTYITEHFSLLLEQATRGELGAYS
ncbi:hypothetical protein RIVM261_071370 [Rivularia sp. IAM M-261]|nr:hypothetical protein RIVM261_071370 [Rivularia sp. IAM M-261]